VLRRAWVPVLFASLGGNNGILARLCVEVVQDGTGEVYPDPIRFDPTPVSALFLRTVAEALAAAWKVPPPEENMPLLDLHDIDVRWRIELAGLPRDSNGLLQPLRGRSLGAALAVVFLRLLWQQSVDERYALTATVQPDGTLGRVEHVRVKTMAALSAANRRGGRAIRRVIVAVGGNEQEARQAAIDVGRADADLAVATGQTLREVLERIDEYPRLIDINLARNYHP
jgi:hypothetical protein